MMGQSSRMLNVSAKRAAGPPRVGVPWRHHAERVRTHRLPRRGLTQGHLAAVIGVAGLAALSSLSIGSSRPAAGSSNPAWSAPLQVDDRPGRHAIRGDGRHPPPGLAAPPSIRV